MHADDKYDRTNLICSVWLTLEPVWENISGRPEGATQSLIKSTLCVVSHTPHFQVFRAPFHMESHLTEFSQVRDSVSFLLSHEQANDNLPDVTFDKGEWNIEQSKHPLLILENSVIAIVKGVTNLYSQGHNTCMEAKVRCVHHHAA